MESFVDILQMFWLHLQSWVPFFFTVALGVACFKAFHWLAKSPKMILLPDNKLIKQMISAFIAISFLMFAVLTLPIESEARDYAMQMFALFITGAIALGSTSLLGNTMAGFMLKALQSFRPGDFIRVDGMLGRVSEQGLLHTEIQNEQRNLVTLPNLFLVTKPFEVLPKSGTVVSATVSLGYDVHQSKITKLLKKAALDADLTDPFVHVMELGDFSVSYRISGLLKEVKFLVSARSELRANVLDFLHEGGIEIMSPNFMNQIPITDGRAFIPKKPRKVADSGPKEKAPESIIFDKANQAESRDNLMEKTKELEEKIAVLKTQKSETKEEAIQKELESRIEMLTSQKERILKYLEAKTIEENTGSKM